MVQGNSDEESWLPSLEFALHALVTYRYSGIIAPDFQGQVAALLHQATQQDQRILATLQSKGAPTAWTQADAYARLFAAAGWTHVAEQVQAVESNINNTQ